MFFPGTSRRGRSRPSLGHTLTRRRFLQLGALGLGLPQWLELRAPGAGAPARGFGRAKSCIVLFAWGGMSHLDTWDPKPEAPSDVRGEFQPIATSVDGIQIGEHMPRLAKLAHHLAIVRSVHHAAPSHRSAAYWNLTGHAPPRLDANWDVTRQDWPCIGALTVAALEQRRDPRADLRSLPRTLALPYSMADGGPANGQDGGFLGPAYDPVLVRPPGGTPYNGVSPHSSNLQLSLPEGVDAARFQERRRLHQALDGRRVWQQLAETRAAVQSQEMALDLMLEPAARNAFDLDREPPTLRELYGTHICGQSVLLARRLTEAGVPLVTVYCAAGDLNGSAGAHFDTHGDNFNRLKNDMLPPLDRASSALIADLQQRGRLDDTLVVWLTEFGRTPRINPGAGRDHFPNCYSVAFAGGGIRGGQVHGASDKTGHAPADKACGPADLHATIFAALGVDPGVMISDLTGRPHYLCDGRPLPLV